MRGRKFTAEKALIPLPPTGFTSLFCAKAGGGANDGSVQARCGGCGPFCNCTECKVLQKSAAALHSGMGPAQFEQRSEAPGLQGVRLRKPAADEVFVFGTVHTRCESLTAQPNSKTAMTSAPRGFPAFCGIARHHHGLADIQHKFRCRKKTPKLMTHGYFSDVGWEKGNFSKRGIKTGWSSYRSWLSPITSEGNLR